MKTVVVLSCIIALTNALSLVIPVQNYRTNFEYDQENPDKIIDLVSDEEQLLSNRVGRQYYSNGGLTSQTQSKC